MSNIVSYLFETNAIRICPENKPFWYTSGKIGPYFINTHFVYGSETEANELLKFIDEALSDKKSLPKKVFEKIQNQYNTNSIFKNVIDEMVETIKQNISTNEIDYISGGERRDWPFSYMIANILNKPHITIYKDLSTIITDSNFSEIQETENLENKKVLHIADLITVASSYITRWIPTIKKLNANMCWSCAVVDRMQGGQEKLEAENIKSISLVKVDKTLFQKALELNVINESQLQMLNKFFDNPDETMRQFLINHPEFIENSLKADEKTKLRAQTLLDQNLYNLN